MYSSRHRLLITLLAVAILGVPMTAFAQAGAAVPPNTTPPQPAAAQPTLPDPASIAPSKPDLPVVDKIVEERQPLLNVNKAASRPKKVRRHRLARHIRRGHYGLPPIDRPALAGVELVAPLPPPGEPPHIVVPTPAYPLEAIVAGITTPPPPIVCHHVRRDPSAPDPRLYREQPVQCLPDNP